MAIVEMKRLTLLALIKDREKLLKAIQRMGCIQITDIPEEGLQPFLAKEDDLKKAEEEIVRLRWTIDKLSRYDTVKPPLFGNKPEVSREQAEEVLSRKESLLLAVSETERCERQTGELKGQEARLHASIEQFAPWAGLDIPAHLIHNTRDTVQQAGTMARKAFLDVSAKWASEPAVLMEVGAQQETVCVYAVSHLTVGHAFQADLKEAGFTPMAFGDMQGTPRQQLDAWEKELAVVFDGYKQLESKLASQAKELKDLRILFDILTAQRDRLQAANRFAATETTFLLKGWVPSAMVDIVKEKLSKVSPSVCMEANTPEEGDDPPVMLRNNRAAAPFEMVVSGFSLPAPYSLDPTLVMMPFFACFFGMMVSDAGYGLLMALVIPLIIKLAKPSTGAKRLMWILSIGGVSTLFWGFMYNTWFGFAPLPVFFDPINNALPVMALCVGIGAVHLFTGLFVGASLNFRRGKPLDALYDQFSWFMLVVGLGLLILPATAQIGKVLAIAGAGIILLTAGRNKSKNPFKRLISGLGALYGVTSWVSDLLSYMRLFGMGLATGVIGMVINQLVGMVFSAGIIGKILGAGLFVGGHLFNAGINILGAYVHSCRLQYIEFFGKFYEDGGKPFMPLEENTRYVRIKDA